MLQGPEIEQLVKSFGLAAVGLYALGLVLRYRPWERRDQKHNGDSEPNGSIGSKSVAYCRHEGRLVVKECLKEHEEIMNNKMREIIREELEGHFRR